MRVIVLLLPLLAAAAIGYVLGQRSRQRAVDQITADLLPVVAALSNLLDADPMDPQQTRLRRMEARDVLDRFFAPRRRGLG